MQLFLESTVGCENLREYLGIEDIGSWPLMCLMDEKCDCVYNFEWECASDMIATTLNATGSISFI